MGRSPIHMPRWASRIDLHVKSVRVERVQEISAEDAIAKGIMPGGVRWIGDARGKFRDLWNALHGPGAWDRNDWVWVYEWESLK